MLSIALSQNKSKDFQKNKIELDQFYDGLRRMDYNITKRAISKITNQNYKSQANELFISIYKNKQIHPKTLDTNDVDLSILKHLSLGYYNQLNNNTKDSYQAFSKAIKLSNSNSRSSALKFSLISMLNLLRKQFFTGDESFVPYLNHYREIADDKTDERIIILFEIGLLSNENDNMESAFQGFEKIEQLDNLFSKVSEGSPLKPKYYFEKAVQLKLARRLDNSMFFFRKSNQIARNQVVNRDIFEASTWHISTLHLVRRQMDSAIYYWKKSKGLSKNLRNRFYNERLGSWIYKAQNQYDSAYFYLNKSNLTEAQLEGRNQRFQSSILAIENQTEKLKMDKLALDNRRKTNQNYLIIALSVLTLGALTAIFLQKNTTKKRQLAEQEAELKQQRVDNLLKEQELVSIDAMIAGQEKERQKVAGELHDDLGSLMATIKLHFENAKVGKKDPALQSAQKLLEEAYQKIRGMAHSKNSGVMSDQGLLPALKKMAHTISETGALRVTIEDFGLGERLENSLELSIFRMIQELVANAIKHAKASEVNIHLTQHAEVLNIIVEDNGKGFDRSKLDKHTVGMGLTNIEKRVEHLEGTFTVDSIVGKGTSILIDIPV